MKIIRQYDSKFGFPYIAYISENISSNPAIIFQLHGAGERGNGSDDLDKVLIHGLAKVVNDSNLKDAILVMPQCPTGSFWVAKIESLKLFIDNIMQEYCADPRRIYLCGLSMGGFGTWYTAMAYPDVFAAIAPCCGGGMAWNAGVLSMPIWTFHGLDDATVSVNQTLEMVHALEGKHPSLKYDLYEGVGHNSWDIAFSAALIDWLLHQEK